MTPHHLKGPRQGHFSRMESWMPGTGSRPCQAHFSAKPVGLTTSHAICSNGGGLLLLVWSSASATSLQKQFCLASVLTSKQQSNPGLGPGHGSIRGYFVPHLSGKVEQICCCNEVALAEVQTTSSHPFSKVNPEQALSRGLASIRGYVLPHLSGKVERKWPLQSSKPVAAIHV